MDKQNKKLMIEAIIFSLIVLIGFIYVNYFYYQNITKDSFLFERERHLSQYKEELVGNSIPLLALGDSHTRRAINMTHIGNGFNYAMDSETYIEQHLKFKELLDQGFEINKILVIYDMQVMMRTDRELYVQLPFYYDRLDREDMSKILDKTKIQLWAKARTPAIGNGNAILRFLNNPNWIGHENFMEKNFTRYIEKERIVIANIPFKYHYQDMDKYPNMINEKSLDYFLKTMELARENDVEVYLIKYPLTKEYNDLVKENKLPREKYYELIEMELNGYNYTILDYYDIYFENPGYFFDGDHLNAIGSKKLGGEIKKDIY